MRDPLREVKGIALGLAISILLWCIITLGLYYYVVV